MAGTVQAQYTGGPLQIASWAHIVNAHVFPGPAIVTALKSGAHVALKKLAGGVSTEIYVGTPEISEDDEDEARGSEIERPTSNRSRRSVMATTTIYQTFNQPSEHDVEREDEGDRRKALQQLGEPPLSRALLLFAQMSSENNLMDAAYTQKSIEIAQQNRDFVIGFISQRSLNSAADDNFLCMTPGVKLPPPGAAADAIAGDGLGQQYRTPEQVILKDGCDVVIVGRGIIAANNRKSEAERYQAEAWKAYERRIGAI